MEPMIYTNTTQCGHMFCEYCISEWNLFNRECPLCRHPLKQSILNPCPMMDSVIEAYVEKSMQKKDWENYLERKVKVEKWKESKK